MRLHKPQSYAGLDTFHLSRPFPFEQNILVAKYLILGDHRKFHEIILWLLLLFKLNRSNARLVWPQKFLNILFLQSLLILFLPADFKLALFNKVNIVRFLALRKNYLAHIQFYLAEIVNEL